MSRLAGNSGDKYGIPFMSPNCTLNGTSLLSQSQRLSYENAQSVLDLWVMRHRSLSAGFWVEKEIMIRSLALHIALGFPQLFDKSVPSHSLFTLRPEWL
jgi:hypothetical protein